MKVQFLETCEECGHLQSARPVLGVTTYQCLKVMADRGAFRQVPDPAVIPDWCPLPDVEDK